MVGVGYERLAEAELLNFVHIPAERMGLHLVYVVRDFRLVRVEKFFNRPRTERKHIEQYALYARLRELRVERLFRVKSVFFHHGGIAYELRRHFVFYNFNFSCHIS